MTSTRDTVIRSLHDLGAAAWFGGSLMGAIGVNGAANGLNDPTERAALAANGWARWAPVSAVAIAAHLIGGAGLVVTQRDRVRQQAGVTANTVVKTGLTGLALASTAYSGVLGARIAAADKTPSAGGTKPTPATSEEVSTAQQQLRALQWVTPALTGALIALGSQQGEQQRPAERIRGRARKLVQTSRGSVNA